jgi:hypothetical protein
MHQKKVAKSYPDEGLVGIYCKIAIMAGIFGIYSDYRRYLQTTKIKQVNPRKNQSSTQVG